MMTAFALRQLAWKAVSRKANSICTKLELQKTSLSWLIHNIANPTSATSGLQRNACLSKAFSRCMQVMQDAGHFH